MANGRLISVIFGIVAIGLLVFLLHFYGAGLAEDNTDVLENDLTATRGSSSRAATYVGSETCGQTGCHVSAYNSWNATVHGRILVNRTEAEAAGLPLPEGEIWDNITYVVGHKWKVQYLNETGYFITSDQNGPGDNQWDVRDQEWTDYHAGELLLQYTCGNCHTTGYNATDNITGMPGIVGNWSEEGVGCEACHGPGSDHASSPSPSNIGKDTSAEACGKCHQAPYNNNITVVNPGRTNHGQYNDWYQSKHQEADVDCVSCHDPHDISDAIYGTYTNYTEVKPAKVKYLLGGSYISVASTDELCGKCHSNYDTNLGHGNGTVDATCVDCHMAPSRTTVNEWDIRSHTFKVNDGVDYDPSADPNTMNFPYFTCEQSPCHTDGIPHFAEWNSSAHADTNHGYNSNTYCAHCMSPFQGDPAATGSSSSDPVNKQNWTGINCAVCHDLHKDPSTIAFYNGTTGQRDAPVSNPADLCGQCHQGNHPNKEKWTTSAHAKTYSSAAANTYCAKCMSPFQHDPAATHDTNDPVAQADWWGITCTVCHDQHSLELALFNGTDREAPVDDPSDLCGGCHGHSQYAEWEDSAHANSYHAGSNDNTYCAHCMSPFQFEEMYNETIETNRTYSKQISEADWDGIGCIVCHDEHSLKLAVYNGTDREAPVDNPAELCGACHTGHHAQYEDWDSSAHSDTYHTGQNDNTYCAKCMSPYQFDPLATYSENDPVAEKDWQGITCTICHNPHSLELQFYNGTEYSETITDPTDLCAICHSGHHPQYEEWNSSAHSKTNHGYNSNTYCAKCMSPYQFDVDATSSDNDPVSAENWTGIGCAICHDQHTLELALFNGTGREKPVSQPAELCGKCHSGHHPQYEEWSAGAHSKTYHGYNDDQYCAHCMSPLQGNPEATGRTGKAVGEANWTSIDCIICHNKHSLELEFYNGSAYETDIDQPADLCAKCHGHSQSEEWEESAHANTYHTYNDDKYCAHCMSPLQGDPEATGRTNIPVGKDNWTSIDCIICHNQHSLELEFFNGSAYETDIDQPADLCGKCHSGNHPVYSDWSKSAHSDTFSSSKNNTYCAQCHSPMQADTEATSSDNKGIEEEDWYSVDCIVCHNKHSLELSVYNGSAYVDVEDDPNEVCGQCHKATEDTPGHVDDIHTQWEESAHFDTWKGFNGNTYCSHCMSPYQSDPTIESSGDAEPVSQENWTSIGCVVCHEKHTLELGLYNGSAFNPMDNTNELCGSCHTMEGAGLGDEPHHSQLEMRTGTGLIGITSKTYKKDVMCGDCHGYDSDHGFHPDEAACVDCHSGFSTEEEAAESIEEIQNETLALLDKVEASLTLAEKAKESAEENGTWSTEMNTSYYTALFNYEFVLADGSTGFHNPDYAKDALEDANDRFGDIIEAVDLLPSIKVTPADGSTDVPVDSVITVQFEEEINFTDLQTNSHLTVSGGITGTVTYDSATHTVTFTPSADLPYATLITVTLSDDVEYADGSGILTKDYSWSFTTESEPVTDKTIVIGPIKDEDGNPISGAKVTVTMGGKEFSGTTNSTGYATITIPASDFVAGTATVKVTKDGYDDLEFTVTVGDDGTVSPPSSGYPAIKEEAAEEDSNIMMLLIVIIVIIIVVVVLLMVLRQKKPEEEVPAGEEEEETEEAGEEFECPACGTVVPPGETACPECGTEFEDEEMAGEAEEGTEEEDAVEDEEAYEEGEEGEEGEDEYLDEEEYEEEESFEEGDEELSTEEEEMEYEEEAEEEVDLEEDTEEDFTVEDVLEDESEEDDDI